MSSAPIAALTDLATVEAAAEQRWRPLARSVGRATLDPLGATWLDLAMKSVKIAELKDRLSEHLRAVERGSEVVVTDRNRPIARLMPIAAPHAPLEVVPPKVSFSWLRGKKYPRAAWAVGSSELLAEERRER